MISKKRLDGNICLKSMIMTRGIVIFTGNWENWKPSTLIKFKLILFINSIGTTQGCQHDAPPSHSSLTYQQCKYDILNLMVDKVFLSVVVFNGNGSPGLQCQLGKRRESESAWTGGFEAAVVGDFFSFYEGRLGKPPKQIFGKSWDFGPTGL